MIELVKYESCYKNETIIRIADFFGYHASLLTGTVQLDQSNYIEAEETLNTWINDSHELYMIKSGNIAVGFLHLGYRGGNVAWIEDIYVDKEHRNEGIATKSIRLAEEIIKSKPNYNAVCFDVVPRNEIALKLYYKLGYDSLSILTVRKELYNDDRKRDKSETIFGLNFKY